MGNKILDHFKGKFREILIKFKLVLLGKEKFGKWKTFTRGKFFEKKNVFFLILGGFHLVMI